MDKCDLSPAASNPHPESHIQSQVFICQPNSNYCQSNSHHSYPFPNIQSKDAFPLLIERDTNAQFLVHKTIWKHKTDLGRNNLTIPCMSEWDTTLARKHCPSIRLLGRSPGHIQRPRNKKAGLRMSWLIDDKTRTSFLLQLGWEISILEKPLDLLLPPPLLCASFGSVVGAIFQNPS